MKKINNKKTIILNRKILIASVSLILGILSGYYVPIELGYLAIVLTVVFIILLLITKKNQLLYFIVFFSGIISISNQIRTYRNCLLLLNNQTVSLEAIITDKEIVNNQDKITAKIENIKLKNKKIICENQNIVLFVPQNNNAIPGHKIFIENLKVENKSPKKFKNYFLRNHILMTLFYPKNKIIYKKNKHFSLRKYIYLKKQKIINDLKNKLNKKSLKKFKSIFLGYKTQNVKLKEKQLFNNWGISHYLARSGLHIAIFVLIWSIILKRLSLSLKAIDIILSILIIIYALFSSINLPFIRAFLGFMLARILKHSKIKKIKYIDLLFLIGIIILIFNPATLFFLDFQLTFLLTLALMLSNKNIKLW